MVQWGHREGNSILNRNSALLGGGGLVGAVGRVGNECNPALPLKGRPFNPRPFWCIFLLAVRYEVEENCVVMLGLVDRCFPVPEKSTASITAYLGSTLPPLE